MNCKIWEKITVLNISIPSPQIWIQRCANIFLRNTSNSVLHNSKHKNFGEKYICDAAKYSVPF